MNTKKEVVFMTLDAFKKALGVENIEIKRWKRDTATKKASGKLSAHDEFGTIYRVQNKKYAEDGVTLLHDELDLSKPMSVILEKGAPIEHACIINSSNQSAFDSVGTI